MFFCFINDAIMLLQCMCFMNNFVRAKPVSCWNYLCLGFLSGLFQRKHVSCLFLYLFLLNHAASQSALKFSGLKQPLFIISHESKGHLCSLASLSQVQTVSAGPTVSSGLVGGAAGSWQVWGYNLDSAVTRLRLASALFPCWKQAEKRSRTAV